MLDIHYAEASAEALSPAAGGTGTTASVVNSPPYESTSEETS